MQQIDKVIRIPVPSSDFYLLVSNDYSEWWYNLEDLMEQKEVLKIVKEYDKDIIGQLKKGEADYLSIYSDM
jgi:hypothetical protein